MSKGNPIKAMAALMPTPLRTPEGFTIRPITLAMYAALERIKSPLVTCVDANDVMELLPSLYLLVHGPEAIFEGNLAELAFRWADTVPHSALASIRDACVRQMDIAAAVIPEKKKTRTSQTTDGSRRSSTTSRRSTGGASVKSSGTSRCRR